MTTAAGPDIPPLRLWGDTVLEVPVFAPDDPTSERTREIVDHLKVRLNALPFGQKGYAIAAPQIGESHAIVYVNIEPGRGRPQGEEFAMVNPRILKREKKVRVMEGCLSIPKFFHTINRFHKVTFEYDDLEGKRVKRTATGLLAQVVQHECDHLGGILMIEYVHERNAKRLAKRCIEDCRRG